MTTSLLERAAVAELLAVVYDKPVELDDLPPQEVLAAERLVTRWAVKPSEAYELIATSQAKPEISGEVQTAQQLERACAKLRDHLRTQAALKAKEEARLLKFQAPRPPQPYDESVRRAQAGPALVALQPEQMFQPQRWMSPGAVKALTEQRERWIGRINAAKASGARGPAIFKAVLGYEYGGAKQIGQADQVLLVGNGVPEPVYTDEVPPEAQQFELDLDQDEIPF